MLTKEQIDMIERPADVTDAEWAAALVRFEHAGRWIAWVGEFKRFVAAGDTWEEAQAEARRAGFDRVLLEYVPPADARSFYGPR